MKKPKTLLFDIDGTLVAAGKAAQRAFHRAFFETFGCACDDRDVEFAGRSDSAIRKDILRRSLEVHGRSVSETQELQLVERYIDLLEVELVGEAHYKVLPGILELCQKLQPLPHLKLGLQTGNLREAAFLKLTPGGLHSYFHFGGFGCDSPQRAEIVAKAVQRAELHCGCSRSEFDTFVIGDTPYDIIAGKTNGCVTIAVATGCYTATELAEAAPDFLFEHFSDVARFLAAIGE